MFVFCCLTVQDTRVVYLKGCRGYKLKEAGLKVCGIPNIEDVYVGQLYEQNLPKASGNRV